LLRASNPDVRKKKSNGSYNICIKLVWIEREGFAVQETDWMVYGWVGLMHPLKGDTCPHVRTPTLVNIVYMENCCAGRS
jgi:hypothetical protein